MRDLPLLTIVTFLPLFGAVLFILPLRGEPEKVARNARWAALWISLLTFAASLVIWFGFDRKEAGFQFEEKAQWMRQLDKVFDSALA